MAQRKEVSCIKTETLSEAILRALADQYGGIPRDANTKEILAPVVKTIPRSQRQVFFQLLDARRTVGEKRAV